MQQEIITLIIQLAAVTIPAFFTYLGVRVTQRRKQDRLQHELEAAKQKLTQETGKVDKLKYELSQAQAEISVHGAAMRYTEAQMLFDKSEGAIDRLFAETNIQRFVQFKAINGREAPRWTSAFMQRRSDGIDQVDYDHVPIDAHYVQMIADSQRSPVLIVTENLPKCLLGDIYKAEGVTQSLVCYITSYVIDESLGLVVHIYMSFATTMPEGLSENDMIAAKLVAGQFAGLARKFDDDQAAVIAAGEIEV